MKSYADTGTKSTSSPTSRPRCAKHAQADMARDYHRILYARDGLAARAAYDAFVKK